MSGSGTTGRAGLIGRLALLGFGIASALLIGELAVRLVVPMPPAFSWLRPDGLVLHTPGMHATYFRQEFRTDVRINSLGLRGSELPPKKAAGTLRVLVLGDSYAEGLQVAGDEVLSSRLQAAFDADKGPRVEVVNAGVSGYGTADELVLLEKLGWDLEPDLVLVAFCVHNDVKDNLARPLYDFSSDPPRPAEAPPPRGLALGVLRTKELLSRRSQLYQLLRDRTDDLQPGGLAVRLGLKRQKGNVAAAADAGSRPLDHTAWFEKETPPELAKGVDYTRRLLGRMADECRERGVPMLVALVPLRDQVSDARWEALRAKRSLAPDSRSRPQEMLVGMTAEMGIEVVDLLPVLLRSPNRESLYFDIDGHWTAAGHQVAADALKPALDSWRGAAATRKAS